MQFSIPEFLSEEQSLGVFFLVSVLLGMVGGGLLMWVWH